MHQPRVGRAGTLSVHPATSSPVRAPLGQSQGTWAEKPGAALDHQGLQTRHWQTFEYTGCPQEAAHELFPAGTQIPDCVKSMFSCPFLTLCVIEPKPEAGREVSSPSRGLGTPYFSFVLGQDPFSCHFQPPFASQRFQWDLVAQPYSQEMNEEGQEKKGSRIRRFTSIVY